MSASIKWEPKEVLHKVRHEIDRGFEDIVGLTPTGLTSSMTHWRPRTDISETDTEVIIEFDLPGVASEGIDLTLIGRKLILKADPCKQPDEETRRYARRERYRKQWKRVIELEVDVDHEAIEARNEHGVLIVRLQKKATPEDAGKRIAVT